MSITALPSGKLRVQVYDRTTGRMASAAKVLGLKRDEATFPDTKAGRRAAAKLEERAENALSENTVTVADFRARWLVDPIFHEGWKEGALGPTAVHNAERTKAFADTYGDRPLTAIDDDLVAAWIAGGKSKSTVPALRAMFNAAASARAGRLVKGNPFANLGLSKGKGNKHRKPPSLEQMERLVEIAWDLTTPAFAAYFEFGATIGARPGELDYLKPENIDSEDGEVRIERQWNAKVRRATTPKYGPYTLALTGRAQAVLDKMPRVEGHDEFVFTTDRGHHFTPSTRTHHWNTVRAAAGYRKDFTLYLATRHYFGWYALNIAKLPEHVIATQLGHRDGGRLVRELYGHSDHAMNRAAIRDVFRDLDGWTSHKTSHEARQTQ